MNERLLELRKALGLSQEAFAQKIGLTKSAISNIETGRFDLTESNFKLICMTFNVDENWLRTGEGEMFAIKDADDELACLIGELHASDDEFTKKFIIEFLKLNKKQRDSVKQFVAKLATAIN